MEESKELKKKFKKIKKLADFVDKESKELPLETAVKLTEEKERFAVEFNGFVEEMKQKEADLKIKSLETLKEIINGNL